MYTKDSIYNATVHQTKWPTLQSIQLEHIKVEAPQREYIVQPQLSKLAGARKKQSDNRGCILSYALTCGPEKTVWKKIEFVSIAEVWMVEVVVCFERGRGRGCKDKMGVVVGGRGAVSVCANLVTMTVSKGEGPA